MATLGLAVITFNEERTIKTCLDSVPFATQKVVVDSFSKDQTVSLAKTCGAEVYERAWPGYSEQKQFAADQLRTDWVLVLDADEWLSKEAQNKIKNLMDQNPKEEGYVINREHLFLGRLLKRGKGVDYHLRLFRNGKGKYDGRKIHEKILVKGPVGRIFEPIIHESSTSINEEWDKVFRDSEMELQYYRGEKITFYDIFIKPLKFFTTMFVVKRTFLDGLPGMIFLTMTSFKYFLIYAKMYELSLTKKVDK